MRTCPICKTVLTHARDLGRHQTTKACKLGSVGLQEKGDGEEEEGVSPDSTTHNGAKDAAAKGDDDDDEKNANPEFWKASVARKYEQEGKWD